MPRPISPTLLAALLLTCSAASAAPAPPATQQVEDAKRDLLHGDSKTRLNAFKKLLGPGNTSRPVDGSLLAALEAAASDADPGVRKQVAIWVSTWWLEKKAQPDRMALALVIKLAADDDAGVRDAAVYYGLSANGNPGDDAVGAMVGAAMRELAQENGVRGRVVYGLRGAPPEKIAPHLESYLAKHESEPEKALLAYVLFSQATGKEPPGAERLDKLGSFVVLLNFKPPLDTDPRAALKAFRDAAPAEAVEAVAIAPRPRGTSFEGVAVVKSVGRRRAVLEAL